MTAAACGGPREGSDDADLEFRLVLEQVPAYDCGAGANLAGPGEQATVCDADGVAYLLGPAVITADEVQRAVMGLDPGGMPELQLTLTASGAETFAELTREAAAQPQGQIAIVSEGAVLSAPAVQEQLVTDRLAIIGSDETGDALEELAQQLPG